MPEREPQDMWAIVQGVQSGNVYLRTSDAFNGWNEVTRGFGTDITWGELLYFEDQAVTIRYAGFDPTPATPTENP